MKSIREIYNIGKGPSSSHTMGPEKAAKLFKSEHPEADSFVITLYGSLSKTGKGHGTDRALIETLSPIPTEVICEQEMPEDVKHPNTLDLIALKDAIARLDQRQRSILALRFCQGKTQMEVSTEIGISQAQVSRLEKGAISTIKKNM